MNVSGSCVKGQSKHLRFCLSGLLSVIWNLVLLITRGTKDSVKGLENLKTLLIGMTNTKRQYILYLGDRLAGKTQGTLISGSWFPCYIVHLIVSSATRQLWTVHKISSLSLLQFMYCGTLVSAKHFIRKPLHHRLICLSLILSTTIELDYTQLVVRLSL